jgi:hypothetical protein
VHQQQRRTLAAMPQHDLGALSLYLRARKAFEQIRHPGFLPNQRPEWQPSRFGDCHAGAAVRQDAAGLSQDCVMMASVPARSLAKKAVA